ERNPNPRRNCVSARLELPTSDWQRVSPKYIVVDLIGNLILGVVLVAASSIPAFASGNEFLWAIPASLAIVFIIVIALTPRRVRSIGYQLREDDLLFRRGLMFQRF